MFKALFVLLLSFSVSIPSWGSRFLINQERFNDLSEKEQHEYVIQLMEFMVELESRYEKAVVVHGVDSAEARKYSMLMKQITSFVLAEAHAADPVPPTYQLSEYSKDFANILNPSRIQKDNRCFYAGWMSYVDGQNKCIHPARLNKNTLEYKSYAKQSSCPAPVQGDSSKDMIACNPAIFGFMNIANKSQFCVAGGISKSFNSANICMKLALGLKLSSDEKKRFVGEVKDPSPAEARLRQLKQHLGQSSGHAATVGQFVLKTCVCEPETSKVINKNYLNEVRPHRTCYGMLNMVANAVTCNNPSVPTVEGLNYDLLKKIKELYSSMESASSVTNSTYDQFYRDQLKDFKNTHRSDYNKICSITEPEQPQPKDPDYKCNALCGEETKDGATSYQCEVEVTKDGEPLEADKYTQGKSEKDKPLTIKLKEGDKELTCSVEQKVIPKEPEQPRTPEPDAPLTADSTCTVEVPELKGDETEVEATVKTDLKSDEQVKSIVWDPGKETTPAVKFKKETGTIKAVVTLTKQGKEVTIECSKGFPEKVTAEKPTLSVSGKTTGANFEIKGEIKGNKEGWTLKWSRKGGATPKPEASTIDTHLAGESGDGADKPAQPKPAEPAAETDLGKDNSETFSVAREDEPFEVCGKLVKQGEEDIKGNSCPTVPAKDKPKPAAPEKKKNRYEGMNIPQQGQQQMIRPAANTSAQGIR